MANNKATTELDIVVDDSSVRGMIGLLDEMGKNYDKVRKSINKSRADGAKQFKNLQSSMVDIGDSHRKMLKSFEGKGSLKRIFEENQKGMDEMSKSIEELGKLEAAVNTAIKNKDKKGLAEKQAAYDAFYDQVEVRQVEFLKGAQEQAKGLKKAFIDNEKDLSKYMKKDLPDQLGKGIGGSIKGALEGDSAGILNSLSGIMGGAITAGAKKFSVSRQKKAELRKNNPDMGPGIMDRAKKIPGMGGMTKMLGGLVKMLGPIMAAVGGVAMIVKLLMDAEAQTIELNKALYESTSLFKLGGGSLQLANERMEALRESATDFRTNIRLGLEPKQHFEVLGALEQHNAGINRLSKGYEDFGAASTDVVSTVRMASLNLGTDMSSVAEFIGKMVDVNNKKLPEVQENLRHIVAAAEKSGMSTKNFFSTVSQVTGQMGLYNYRLEDTTFLMGQLSGLMDAETAQKFATSMTTGMKDMNGEERLRLMVLADQAKVTRLLRAENERMFDSISEGDGNLAQINRALVGAGRQAVANAEDVEAALHSAREDGDFDNVVQQLGRENSDLATQIGEASDMAANIARGGRFNADAMGHLQAIDQFELKMSGLENAVGLPLSQISMLEADKLGVDEQQLRVMQRVDRNSRGQMQEIKNMEAALLEDPEGEAQKRALAEMNEKLGLSLTYDEEQQRLVTEDQKTLDSREDLMRQMSADELKELENSTMSAEQAAREQVRATQSVADILQALIYDALNTIGYYVAQISSWIAKKFGDPEDVAAAERSMLEASKRREVQTLQDQVKDTEDAMREAEAGGHQETYEMLAVDREHLLSTIDREKGVISALRGEGSVESILENADEIRQSQEREESGQSTEEARAEIIEEQGGVSSAMMRGAVGDNFAENTGDRLSESRHISTGAKSFITGDTMGLLGSLVGPSLDVLKGMGDSFHDTVVTGDVRSDFEAGHRELDEEGEAAVQDRQREGRQSQSRQRRAEARVQEEIATRLADGVELEEGMDEHLDTISNAVGEDVGLPPEQVREMAKEYAVELMKQQQKEAAIQKIMETTGIGRGHASAFASLPGRDDLFSQYGMEEHQGSVQQILENQGLRPSDTEDAQILSGGFAPHLFAPGDMIIKSDEIANTLTGSAGQFVPDLFNAIGGSGGSGGGGSGMAMHNTFNINGGNLQEVENTILRVLEMAERKRYGES